MGLDKIILFPYYATLAMRNHAYDKGWKKSYRFRTPVICVGNITVGGTGKTPHIEELVRMFKEEYRIAVVSRGYGRKTKGYLEVQPEDTFQKVGDEPLQIKRKFPDITVIVDESRKEAIEKLEAREESTRPTLILLDDAFQHRKIQPQLSILLVNYERPIFKDSLLPIGRLRDLTSQVRRADIVIVTKVPIVVDKKDEMKWRHSLKLRPEQKLYFSTMVNEEARPVFEECDRRYTYSRLAISFSGIADPTPFNLHIRNEYTVKGNISFGDHHSFTRKDIDRIVCLAQKHPNCLIVTTEKDSQRLIGMDLPEILRKRMACIPTRPQILPVGAPDGIEYGEERTEIALGQFRQDIKNMIEPKI